MKKSLFILSLSILFYFNINAQTLQQVTDAGNVTNQTITVNGVEAVGGFTRYYSNGLMNSFIGSDASAFGQGGDDAIHYVYGNNKFHIATNAVRRFTVDGSGNVGIGTQSPDNGQGWNRVLNLHGTGHAKLMVTESTGVKVGIYSHAGYNGKIGTESNHNLSFTAGYWNDVMTLTTQGNVGIGTLTPGYKLDVNGTARFTQFLHLTSNDQEIQFYRNNNVYGYIWSSENGLHWGKSNSTNSINITNQGNVGIGTFNTHNYKLAVAGNMIAESVKVELQGTWPDYVFKTGNKLLSLAEVEKYVQQNNHLPEMPSEAEVKKEGIDLGQMDAKLLKKIEELTLHLIEQNKRLENQEKLNSELLRRVKQLEHK